METQELHRGRMIDHIQLVVRDLVAARRFYTAILASLNIPVGGSADDYFWADELFVSSPDSQVGNEGYMLTMVDRGADVLCSLGHIGDETAAALKNEARRRLHAGRFFGHIAYAGLIARKP